MKIYIDESGSLSLNNGEKYFVLTALVCENQEQDKKIKQVCKKIHRLYLQDPKVNEIHACKLRHNVKEQILNEIANFNGLDLEVYYLVVDKNQIEKNLILHQNLMYSYLAGVLLKEILYIAKEDVEVIIDNHNTKFGSINSLHEYLKIKALFDFDFKYHFTSRFMESHVSKGLQIVDIISNSIFNNYNKNKSTLYKINLKSYSSNYYPNLTITNK